MSDLIERQAAIDTEGLDEQIRCEMCRNPMHTDRGCDGNCKYDEKLYERIMQILGERIKPLPSVQPEKRTDKHTETHACDCVSRQAAIDAIEKAKTAKAPDGEMYVAKINAEMNIQLLPSVQPEPHYDEWCNTCKEYDQEKHCCPRWNRVIRKTVTDMKSQKKPERKPDTIQKFHDYQVEWLKSHYDIEFEPQLEEMIIRFLHDTANCYMMEIDREEGGQE